MEADQEEKRTNNREGNKRKNGEEKRKTKRESELEEVGRRKRTFFRRHNERGKRIHL